MTCISTPLQNVGVTKKARTEFASLPLCETLFVTGSLTRIFCGIVFLTIDLQVQVLHSGWLLLQEDAQTSANKLQLALGFSYPAGLGNPPSPTVASV